MSTEQIIVATVGTANAEIAVDYGHAPPRVTRYVTVADERGVVHESSDELAAADVSPAGWRYGAFESTYGLSLQNIRDSADAVTAAHEAASRRWRVFRRRNTDARAAARAAEMMALDSEVATAQGARIDAANDLHDANARCRVANDPESTASAEEDAALRAEWDAARVRLDEAESALSYALARRREFIRGESA